MSEAAFLAAIDAEPDDDTVRLVFADWLDEHGDPHRAEFVRVQVELARLAPDDPRRPALKKREGDLLLANRVRWLGERAGAAPVFGWGFSRGFPEHLNFSRGKIDAAGVAALAASPHLGRVTHLDFRGTYIGDEGAAALASSPHLARLTTLNLYGAGVGAEGVAALLSSPRLARLTALDLGENEIGDAGAAMLASSPRLTVLGLRENGLTGAGAAALAASPHLGRLTALDLSVNQIGDEGAAALAASPTFARLTTLTLSGSIGYTGALALAASHLTRLTRLELGSDRMQAAGREVLTDRFGDAVAFGRH